jgi:adenylylsulfate kinase
VRRVAEVSKLFADAGAIVLAGLISPYKADREFAREVHKNASLPFLEVYVDAPLSVVEARDPKGLYKKARAGQIKGFTGLDAPYEEPQNPEIHVRTDQMSIAQAVNLIMERLDEVGLHLSPEFNLMEEPKEGSCPTTP